MPNFTKEDLKNVIDASNFDPFLLADLYAFVQTDGALRNKDVVGVEEFITNPNYMNARTVKNKSVIYPTVMEDLIELNNGSYSEGVLAGGIGTAKTTIALYTQAYQLYLLSCYVSPHEVYDLDPASEIVILFQNLTATKAKEVDYNRFRAMIENSPYFQNHFQYDTDIKSQLQFPNNIIVKPIAGDVSGSLGENVIGGIIDEVNFMSIVEKSKMTHDGTEYNQAEVLYNSLARRRESRFMKKGNIPGIICLVSSKRYPGEFTDVKMDEAANDDSIYVYDKCIWDVKPKGTFSEKTFRVFIGTESENPFIIEESDKEVYDEEYVLEVPVDFRKQFETDILDALREIGGISVRSVNPFILDVSSIYDMFHKQKTILNRTSVEFKTQKLTINAKRFKQKHLPRFVHIDIGLTNNHLGIACGYCPKFKNINRGQGLIEQLPVIEFDFAIDVVPPPNDQIDLSKIRALIYKLYSLGLNIRWVSMDSFNSADMIQRLRGKGFKAGIVSVDRTMEPYTSLKYALVDRRVKAPYHPRLEKELVNLEHDVVKDKVDHPSHGSKDIADCLAGVVHGLSRQKSIWIDHGISLGQMNDYASRFVKVEKDKDEEEQESYLDMMRRLRGEE